MPESSSSDYWERLQKLYLAGRELSPEERAQFLARECAGDADQTALLHQMWSSEDYAGLTRGLGQADPITLPAHRMQNVSRWSSGQEVCNGRFLINSFIAAGGMGEVYSATDRVLGRLVALKVLASSRISLGAADTHQWLQHEARVLASAQHPNICTILDLQSQDGSPVLIMELLEGESLAERLARGPLTTDEAFTFANQILDALACLHGRGIVHQDLKPGNIMVTATGLKILDFGIARAASSSLEIHGGSGRYMSPEQRVGGPVDKRCDIYALGVVLGDMTTPVDGKRPLEQPRRHPLFEPFIRKCLAEDPAKRFQHAGEAKQFLTRLRTYRKIKVLAAPALLSLLMLGFLISNIRSAGDGFLEFQKFTPQGEFVHSLALSPDGNSVVYSADSFGQLDLWVRPLPNGEPVRMTSHKGRDINPAFHPNGQQIAYWSDINGEGIYVIPVAGGTPTKLVDGGDHPVYSPDGRWIAWMWGPFRQGNGTAQIWIMPAAGGERRRIASDFRNAGYPRFSPDSRRIVFEGCSKDCNTYVESVAGGAADRVTLDSILKPSGIARAELKVWTRSGMYLDVDRGVLTFVPLTLDLKAGNPQKLAATTLENRSVSVSSTSIALVNQTGHYSVVANEFDTNRPTGAREVVPIPRTSGDIREPTLSPDGKYLAYVSIPKSFQDPWNTLNVLELATNATSSLAPNARIDANKSLAFQGVKGWPFFVSGNRLIFSVSRPRPASFKVPHFGAAPDPLVQLPVRHISFDGKWVLLGGNQGAVIADELSSDMRAVILDPGPDQIQAPRISPDQKWVAFEMQRRTSLRPQIYVAPFEGLKPVPQDKWILIAPGEAMESAPEWSPDSRTIYFLSERDGHRCLWAIGFKEGHLQNSAIPVTHFDVHEERRGLRNVEDGEQRLSAAENKLSMLIKTADSWGMIARLPRGLR